METVVQTLFQQFGLDNTAVIITGLTAITGGIFSYLGEVSPKYQGFTPQQKRFSLMGACLLIPLFLWTLASLGGWSRFGDGGLLVALLVAFGIYISSQAGHGAFLSQEKRGTLIDAVVAVVEEIKNEEDSGGEGNV